MYIIKWTCTTTARSGQSPNTYQTKEEAQELCDELNEEYPTIAHYVTEEKD